MKQKEYILTNHAKVRMRQRGISESDLELVLRDADVMHPGPHGDINAIKIINNRKIKISYVIERKKKKIITAMIMS